jgi:hypothetical protein
MVGDENIFGTVIVFRRPSPTPPTRGTGERIAPSIVILGLVPRI